MTTCPNVEVTRGHPGSISPLLGNFPESAPKLWHQWRRHLAPGVPEGAGHAQVRKIPSSASPGS